MDFDYTDENDPRRDRYDPERALGIHSYGTCRLLPEGGYISLEGVPEWATGALSRLTWDGSILLRTPVLASIVDVVPDRDAATWWFIEDLIEGTHEAVVVDSFGRRNTVYLGIRADPVFGLALAWFSDDVLDAMNDIGMSDNDAADTATRIAEQRTA